MIATLKGKRQRPQQAEAGAKRPKTVPPRISPTVKCGNRVVWNDIVSRDWTTDVVEVVIEEDTPGGGQKYLLRVEDVQEVRISAFSSHKLTLDNEEVRTTACSFSKYRAQLLIQHVGKLHPPGDCRGLIQHVRSRTESGADSDDESIEDEEIPPAYTDTELPVVSECYEKLNTNFVSAMAHHFTNAAGKMFFYSLGEYILKLHYPTAVPYCPYISTNPHGKQQPGSMLISHSCPAAKTRQAQPDDFSTVSIERVSDFVMYNHDTEVYTIVGELTSDSSVAENQNIEQMIGLWRKNQRAMLGFTCNRKLIEPRVLLWKKNILMLSRLPQLSLEEDSFKYSLLQLAELFTAFTSFVATVL